MELQNCGQSCTKHGSGLALGETLQQKKLREKMKTSGTKQLSE